MVTRIFSYSQVSQGSRALAEALGIKRLRREGSKFVGGREHTIINWGGAAIPEVFLQGGTRVINRPEMVRRVANKLQAFTLLDGHCRIPPYTSDNQVVRGWLEKKKKVFARTVLNGHSGAGIVVMDPEHPDTWDVRAPLYTQYIPKELEFRIHMCRGEVIGIQRKGLRNDVNREEANWLIRNLANGFVYVRNDNMEVPADVIDQAKAAIARSELDFGAVDVIWNRSQRQAYVLEINTAPGLVGTTIEEYANALRRI